ncbi:MAG TPA: TolC family protein [Anaeromyxobacteraceae bacterium]|nr:TolC family protein [Anaeromyxobacteraceae bacterium]
MIAQGLIAALLLTQAGAVQPEGPQAIAGPTLSLEEALRQAQARNLDLKAARERLLQSRELSAEAWSAYLPQVSASGTYTHNSYSDVTFPEQYAIRDCGTPGCFFDANGNPQPAPPPSGVGGTATTLGIVPVGPPAVIAKQDALAAEVRATQALLNPQAWYTIASARAGEDLAAETTEGTRRDILFATAQAYYNAASLKQVVKVQERQLAIALDHEKDARVRFDAGTTNRVTLLRAEIDRARAEQDLKRAQNAYISGRVALATLIDRKDVAFEVTVPPHPTLPEGDSQALEEAALKDRPDVKVSALQITVNEKNRNAVFSRYFPTLGAFGRYDYANTSGFSGVTSTWAVGLSLNFTLLDGLLRESDLRESEAKVREAVATDASTRAKALQEVAQARLDLDSAIANRQKAKEELAFAQENQRLVNVNYQAGTATYLEVSDANTALLQAELSEVSESLNADLASLRVEKAVGAFDPR